MTEPQQTPDTSRASATPAALKNPRVRRLLGVLAAVVVLALLAWLVYWLQVGRYLQSTDNAYLQADAVAVAPRVNGYVTAVLVEDNQAVKAGQPLVRIDARSYNAGLAQAEALVAVRQADIAAARAGLAGHRSEQEQARARLAAAEATLRFARAEVARFGPLAASGADTHEHQESLQHDLDQARAQLRAATAQLAAAESAVAAGQAQLEQAEAALGQARADADQARIAVEDTELTARIDGRIGDKTVQVGQFVAAGTRLMTVVPVQSLYLAANFKETQVGLMRPGQPAEIEVDALPGIKLRGRVESIAPGTGAQFALLPPENATGNFTKVVQRVPVRIAVQADAAQRQVLVPGMSVEVTVDTRSARDQDKPARAAGADPETGR